MLKSRLLTAIFLLVIFIPILLFTSPKIFDVMTIFIIFFAAGEWANLLGLEGKFSIVYALFTGFFIIPITYLLSLDTIFLYWIASAFWILVAPMILIYRAILSSFFFRMFLLFVGIIVFNACWNVIVTARTFDSIFLISLLLLVWSADIGSYFIGRSLGKHKLAATISPGKTWEGLIGGWISTITVVVISIIFHPFNLNSMTFYEILVKQYGFVNALIKITMLVILSVIGDLFESALKREIGVKNSGKLLPGHGGILDRLDSLLPVLPVAMILVH